MVTRCWVCRSGQEDRVRGVCHDCGRWEGFRPLRVLAAAVSLGLLVCAVLLVQQLRAVGAALAHVDAPPSLATAFGPTDTIADLHRGRAELLAADERILDRVEATTVLLGLAVVATAVVFLLWFTRVRANADLFVPRRQRMNVSQSVAGWLLPVVQLVAPRLAIRDVWRVSQSQLGKGEGERPATVSRAWYESWWVLWAAALGTSYSGYWQWWENEPYAVGYLSAGGQVVPEALALESALQWLFAAGVLLLACAVAAVVLVWRLTRLQETTRTEGPSATPRPPAPWQLTQAEALRRVATSWGRS